MITYDNKFIFEILKHQIMNRTARRSPNENPYESAAKLFWDSVCNNHTMYLNKTKFPDIRGYYPYWAVWVSNYAESIMIHHLFEDDYSESNSNIQESTGTDPPYCYENVIVEKGDVVIDAGAYIGDWAAVAAVMGGRVYAFEPSPHCHELLKHTSWLNGFEMMTEGLGDLVCKKMIDTTRGVLADTINDYVGVPCDMTTIDKFASDNNLHIDFIKSDVEGYERYMLKGARRVLIEDQPKLSIRTYHNNGEDAVVLPQLIKNINPNYKIINKRKTLYAYVE
jgi:FkbM family methyltransferase